MCPRPSEGSVARTAAGNVSIQRDLKRLRNNVATELLFERQKKVRPARVGDRYLNALAGELASNGRTDVARTDD